MKLLTKKDRRSDLQKEIDRLYSAMELMDPTTAEYASIQKQYLNLMEQRTKEKSKFPSPDACFQGVLTLMSIGMIMLHEREHVFSTKALGFVPKLFRRG